MCSLCETRVLFSLRFMTMAVTHSTDNSTIHYYYRAASQLRVCFSSNTDPWSVALVFKLTLAFMVSLVFGGEVHKTTVKLVTVALISQGCNRWTGWKCLFDSNNLHSSLTYAEFLGTSHSISYFGWGWDLQPSVRVSTSISEATGGLLTPGGDGLVRLQQ